MKCANCKLAYGSRFCNYDDGEVQCLVTGDYVDIDEGSCKRTNKWIERQNVEDWKIIASDRTTKAAEEFLDFMENWSD